MNRFARGNTRDLRVLRAVDERGLPYRIVGLDRRDHDLDTPELRAKNPFGQLPMIVDDGVVVTESGAPRLGHDAPRPARRPARWPGAHRGARAGINQGLVQPYANVLADHERCTARPMWKKTLSERVQAA